MSRSVEQRLQQYTLQHPQELLIVTAEVEGQPDQVVIFKGHSSSLVRPTAFDPDVPVLPEAAKIIAIDRVASPYNPQSPRYLQRSLTWQEMEPLLKSAES